MKTIDIEDTVTFHRPPVGEERTEILSIYANKDVPRRSPGSGKTYTARTAFAYVGSTDELPLVPAGIYRGRHRKPEPEPVAAPQPRPGLLVRALALVGINLARGA